MRTIFIEVRSPPPDHHARLFPAAEPLDAQALVPDFAVELLRIAVLPRLARLDQAGLDASIRDPTGSASDTNSGSFVRTPNVGAATRSRDKAGCRSHHERIDPATSIARHSRVPSSTTVRHLI